MEQITRNLGAYGSYRIGQSVQIKGNTALHIPDRAPATIEMLLQDVDTGAVYAEVYASWSTNNITFHISHLY